MTGATKELEKHNLEIRREDGFQNQETASQNSETQPRGELSIEQTQKQEVQTPQGVERTRTGKLFLPAVDIYETADAVVLLADMPGVDENSVDITLEKNILTIYGRVEPQQPAGHNLAYSEYNIGDYHRSFSISNEIDWEHIEGTVKGGVLRLTLPKTGPAQTKKISVKSA